VLRKKRIELRPETFIRHFSFEDGGKKRPFPELPATGRRAASALPRDACSIGAKLRLRRDGSAATGPIAEHGFMTRDTTPFAPPRKQIGGVSGPHSSRSWPEIFQKRFPRSSRSAGQGPNAMQIAPIERLCNA